MMKRPCDTQLEYLLIALVMVLSVFTIYLADGGYMGATVDPLRLKLITRPFLQQHLHVPSGPQPLNLNNK